MTADLAKLVKPLVWMPGDCADRITAGNYDIWDWDGGYQLCFWSIVQGEPHATLEAAQAAAEAHNVGCVLAALDTDLLAELVGALEWYAEQSRLARLIHGEGDVGRQAIAMDGGGKARAALARLGVQS